MAIGPIDNIIPIIEYVDIERKNGDYASKKQYNVGDRKNAFEHIKWCRRNFGERGDGWDFAGAGKSLTIFIWSQKLQFMYEMWQQ